MDNTPVRTVKLYGKLRQFGREFKLAVNSPAEAIKALCVQVKGFEKFLSESKQNGLEYAIFVGKNNIGENELKFQGDGDIRIAPIITGSKKNGLFQTILGIILIVVAIWFPPAAGAGHLLMAGVSMAAGGIIQMLSPQPKGAEMREQTENKPSYAFGGGVNTTAYGNPIAILAGERIIGGAVISAGVYTEDLM